METWKPPSEEFLERLDGMYALAATGWKTVVLARDPMGIKQLYLGESHGLLVFASERKALWRVGIRKHSRLKPGHVASISAEGVKLSPGRLPPEPHNNFRRGG